MDGGPGTDEEVEERIGHLEIELGRLGWAEWTGQEADEFGAAASSAFGLRA